MKQLLLKYKANYLHSLSAMLIFLCLLGLLTGCSSSSIHSQARIITYLGLTVADADEDDTLKVQAIAGVGLTFIANGEDVDEVSRMLLNLVKNQFEGRRAGLIELMYLEVTDMVQANISLDIPDEYRVALVEAMNGIIAGAELYLQDLEEA